LKMNSGQTPTRKTIKIREFDTSTPEGTLQDVKERMDIAIKQAAEYSASGLETCDSFDPYTQKEKEIRLKRSLQEIQHLMQQWDSIEKQISNMQKPDGESKNYKELFFEAFPSVPSMPREDSDDDVELTECSKEPLTGHLRKPSTLKINGVSPADYRCERQMQEDHLLAKQLSQSPMDGQTNDGGSTRQQMEADHLMAKQLSQSPMDGQTNDGWSTRQQMEKGRVTAKKEREEEEENISMASIIDNVPSEELKEQGNLLDYIELHWPTSNKMDQPETQFTTDSMDIDFLQMMDDERNEGR